jgi:hypothetical protein
MCLRAAFVPHRPNKYCHVTASNGIVLSSPYTPLAIMTASPIASVRVFEPVRDADVGSLRSVRSQRRRRYIARSSCRTIIGSGDMLLAPHHHQLRRSHRSIHCWHGHAARRSALPRERFSPMTRSSYAGASYSCRSRENQKLQWPAPPASVCSQTSRTASR